MVNDDCPIVLLPTGYRRRRTPLTTTTGSLSPLLVPVLSLYLSLLLSFPSFLSLGLKGCVKGIGKVWVVAGVSTHHRHTAGGLTGGGTDKGGGGGFIRE
ncbi:hypothetical protein Hanom_Chr06g00541371 [Helianthus anomalus]